MILLFIGTREQQSLTVKLATYIYLNNDEFVFQHIFDGNFAYSAHTVVPIHPFELNAHFFMGKLEEN